MQLLTWSPPTLRMHVDIMPTMMASCRELHKKNPVLTLFPCRKLGFTPANEIGNGRWVMIGLAVGMLTEYATGVDFPNQIKLLLSYLGVVDLD